MTITPNLPAPIRRLYLGVGSLAGLVAVVATGLEWFERGLFGLIGLFLLAGAITGYCGVYQLLRFGARRK